MHKRNFEQGSIEWHEARSGDVTGTKLKSAIGTPKVQATLMYELVAERMTETEIIELNTPAIERGREMEPFAIKRAGEHRGIEYGSCGMLVSDEIKGFAMSPDGIYEVDGEVIGGIETKCPSSKKHIEYLLNDAVPKDYFHQVLSPFVCGDSVQWWDFASYDDRNYERDLFIIRVERKDIEKEIEAARVKLKEFLYMVDSVHAGLIF